MTSLVEVFYLDIAFTFAVRCFRLSPSIVSRWPMSVHCNMELLSTAVCVGTLPLAELLGLRQCFRNSLLPVFVDDLPYFFARLSSTLSSPPI